MKNLIALIVLMFLFSCSPQNRLNRLLKNHPHLVDTTTIKRKLTIDSSNIVNIYKDTALISELSTDLDSLTKFILDNCYKLKNNEAQVVFIKNQKKQNIKQKYIEKCTLLEDTVFFNFKKYQAQLIKTSDTSLKLVLIPKAEYELIPTRIIYKSNKKSMFEDKIYFYICIGLSIILLYRLIKK